MRYLGINEELANAILQYLAQKPYIEVGGLIDGLKAMPLVVQPGLTNEETATEETPAEAIASEAARTPEVVEESPQG